MLGVDSYNMLAGKSGWEWSWGRVFTEKMGRCSDCYYPGDSGCHLLCTWQYVVRVTCQICWSVSQKSLCVRFLMEGI